jgi:hypothetical protein
MLFKKNQDFLEPSVYYQTLLALLDSQPDHVTPRSNQDSVLNNVTSGSRQLNPLANQGSALEDVKMTSLSNQIPLLSAANFVQISKLLKAVPCTQLDRIVLKILRTSPKYILEVESSLLDHCLDNITEERAVMATMLISSSACLRGHFERRCRSRSQDGAIQQLELDDYLMDFLPVAHCYFSYAESIGGKRYLDLFSSVLCCFVLFCSKIILS